MELKLPIPRTTEGQCIKNYITINYIYRHLQYSKFYKYDSHTEDLGVHD